MKRFQPGKTNKEDRMNFVTYWANYVKTHPDEQWSKQQKMLIDGQIKHARQSKLSIRTYLKLKKKK